VRIESLIASLLLASTNCSRLTSAGRIEMEAVAKKIVSAPKAKATTQRCAKVKAPSGLTFSSR
jgi:hypothetical protein